MKRKMMSPLKIPLTANQTQVSLRHWVNLAVGLLLFVMLIKWIWPSATPFGTFDFWKENQIGAGIKASWAIFLWGGVITSLFAFTLNKKSLNHKAEDILTGGIVISVIAGVLEEIVFRWTIFLVGIIGAQVTNFIFFVSIYIDTKTTWELLVLFNFFI